MPTPLEVTANALITISILQAGRNSAHTWWTGILGCAAFAVLFFQSQLYADVVLQAFFIVTSGVGWWNWLRGNQGSALSVSHTSLSMLVVLMLAGAGITIGYGTLLHRFTDAYAPFWDSAILAFSVVAQLLLMARRVETWPFWFGVNTIAVPLYVSRGLNLTAVLYAIYWINAVVSWRHWHVLAKPELGKA